MEDIVDHGIKVDRLIIWEEMLFFSEGSSSDCHMNREWEYSYLIFKVFRRLFSFYKGWKSSRRGHTMRGTKFINTQIELMIDTEGKISLFRK